MGNKQLSEDDAVHLLRQGKEEGLDYFFRRYYAALTYFAFTLLDDQAPAEDIAAEAFIKLWNRRHQVAMEGSLKAWLYSTVRHACIDHLRREKRLAVHREGLHYIQPASEPPVLHHMIRAETLRRITDTLAGLPPKCRRVFELFYLYGKSHEEIAAALGLSPSTVRNQKARALRLLREKLPGVGFFLMLLLTR